MTATSLAAVIAAQARLADADLAALEERRTEVEADRDRAQADIASRVALRGLDDELLVGKALQRRERRMLDAEYELAAIAETAATKRALLAKLDARARTLASGTDPSIASIAVLRSLADDASAAAHAIAELTRGATGSATDSAWQWPVKGAVTQPFGPSTLSLEPTVIYRGIAIARFHDAIDIAAPFGAPVAAAASGRVTFVGHLPDGAMVVLIAHDDGLVSLSAHLDDTYAPPRVRVGDRVAPGQVVGHVGMTGITTGPHLHFSVHDASGPVDPLSVIAH